MLTKEEHSAIAERLDRCEGLGELYYAVIGEELPTTTSYEQDIDALFTRLNELCDTSNMIELPLDKDGEVIKVGDTVYDKDGEKGKVGGYYYNNGTCKIIIPYGQSNCYINVFPNELTHKRPVTIASLVGEIRRTLSQNTIMNKETTAKILEITNQIEMLGDSND